MKRKNNAVKSADENKTQGFTLDDIYSEGSLNGVRHFQSDRVITRPELHLKRVLISVAAVLIAAALCGITAKLVFNRVNAEKSGTYALLIALVVPVAVVAVKLKSVLVWLVLLYQRLAPERVRKKCVFTPSCSEYMILSIEKYGAIKGVIKGIKRLKRCHLPNHGEDYP